MRLTILLAVLLVASTARAQTTAIAVDANANRHPIDPRVYGVAFGTPAQLSDLNAPLNRYGGDDSSCYNWQQNGSNKGNDWYFESIADSSATAGERGDTFIQQSQSAGADPMITIPTIGWVANLGASRGKLCSFSIAKYGAQTANDAAYFPDAGNGVLASGGDVTGNDPTDAQVSVDSTFQQQWVQHMVSTWGAAANGGVKYYILDNEPSIWFGTHRDVAPTGATMAQILAKMLDYGAKVRAVEPNAIICGPEEWGWSGYLYSGYDQQYGAAHGWSNLPDRTAEGGMDYLPWLLQQLQKNEQATGTKVLDAFTVHYYPQGGEFSNDVTTATQLLRNKSTRSLWDPSYVDQSWINTQVQLIPRLQGWVAQYYPGLQVGITEYNWGAEADINGATAQADIYGIFGRQGLDFATRWTVPDSTTPTYMAMKMYRNYDGQKSGFGDTSVEATVPDPDDLSAFAAVRSTDGALTIMVVNKVLTGTTPVAISLANFAASGTVHAWQLTSANAIDQLPDTTVASSSVQAVLPAQSITLFVVEGTGSGAGGATGGAGSGIGSVTSGSSGAASANGSTVATSPAASSHSGGSGGGGCEVARSEPRPDAFAPLVLVLVLFAARRSRSAA
jgi:hypothetical protein